MKNTGLPTTGRERTWGVGLADINGDGVLDIGAAFGDVLSPNWTSVRRQGAEKAKGEKTRGGPSAAVSAPSTSGGPS